ncbi:MAG: cardiolipin synthase [Geothrix sp.]|uniref:cardiolipin synthase n=1 Tax=Geothrix sp. TaxID=1962974 RepID=UPI0017F55ECE|nr:cardiolipin synthase [Geothrix sp.]NWJ41018.1 cardiolipin synthase [Geothrix sp.]WIL20985.1 MAG: cardiolipin synthase [Geothrix sp.]
MSPDSSLCGQEERQLQPPWYWILAFCLLCSACARLPDLKYLKEPLNTPTTPRVVDGRGPLSEPEAASLLTRRLGRAKVDAKYLAGLEEAATGRPLIAGNQVTLLFDGPVTIAAMMAAVSAARDSINLETYLFDQDPLGMRFADLLIAKQKEGVQVSIIYDCVGTLGTPQAFFDRMQEAGIRLLPFQPVSPHHKLLGWRINNRDHRKVLVVDGRVAFTGGVNITASYARSSLFRSARKAKAVGWRDTHVQIEGPAVAALQWMFLDNWASQNEGSLPERDFFPTLAPAGDKVVRVLRSQPGSNHEIFKAYFVAIQGARTSIHIASAYFVPDVQISKALQAAARRGIDVKVLLPGVSDSWLTTYGSHSFYQDMLDAGVRIYELKTSVLHAKTAVIDGSWSTVGSTNLDTRSFLHNKEVNVVILGDAFGREMEDAFQDDLKDSREITPGTWQQRPYLQRLKEWCARLASYWL